MPRSSAPQLRDVMLALARVHLLHHASQAPIYGSGMAAELSRHGLRLGPGTLYPMLHRFCGDGLLSATTAVIRGKRRKYYSITRKGTLALARLRPRLATLSAEVLPIVPGAASQR
jgi:DNA-binding PadR family transcriptional regulator